MPYNPGIQPRGAEYTAAAMHSLGQSITGAIKENRRKEQEKKQRDAVYGFLGKYFPELSEGDLGAATKAVQKSNADPALLVGLVGLKAKTEQLADARRRAAEEARFRPRTFSDEQGNQWAESAPGKFALIRDGGAAPGVMGDTYETTLPDGRVVYGIYTSNGSLQLLPNAEAASRAKTEFQALLDTAVKSGAITEERAMELVVLRLNRAVSGSGGIMDLLD